MSRCQLFYSNAVTSTSTCRAEITVNSLQSDSCIKKPFILETHRVEKGSWGALRDRGGILRKNRASEHPLDSMPPYASAHGMRSEVSFCFSINKNDRPEKFHSFWDLSLPVSVFSVFSGASLRISWGLNIKDRALKYDFRFIAHRASKENNVISTQTLR